jgi:hypothetical protein
MARITDMKVPLGQGTGIREIQKGKRQAFELNRPLPVTRRKGKKKNRSGDKSADSGRSAYQYKDSTKKRGQEKDSKIPGALLDVVI